MEIKVCIGSACHLKGSYEVLEKFKQLVANGYNDKITLKASFCLGRCGGGVTVAVDGEIFEVTPESVENFFSETVLKRLN